MGGIRVIFGERLDGGAWPPTPGGGELGAAVVGVPGLLSLVETFAGLGGPTVPAARRIATMRQRLASLTARTYYWSESFALDPWAVAREILTMRDELVDAGWTAAAVADPPPRLADLATLERLEEPPLPPGEADRLVAAARVLGAGLELPIDDIVVIDDEATLPAGAGRLLNAIAVNGVRVSFRPVGSQAASKTGDLARVQAWLATGKKEPLTGDGTFVVLQGRSEGTEAEAVADWLAAGSRKSSDANETGDSDTVLVLGTATGLLDGALGRRGLPRLMHLPASPLRGAVQLLSLAFAIRWRPFDPSPLLDLLLLPQSPIPAAAARPVIDTLTETPGRGGSRWTAAIDQGLLNRRKKFEADGLSGDALKRRVEQDTARWLPWLTGELFDEVAGMPTLAAREICARVAAWAARVASDAPGPVAAVGGFATTLSQVIQDAGLDQLPRVQLERMIDAVVAEGVDAEHGVAEAAPWSHVSHPAKVWDEAGTLVWWGCSSDVAARWLPRWTDEEITALQAVACAPELAAQALARDSAGWRRALLKARERVVIVVPPGADRDEGEHPLLHELGPLLSASASGIVFWTEQVLVESRCELAGRTIVRSVAADRSLPRPRAIWAAPANAIAPRPREAATSIELLLGCPFAWALHYPGKLRPSRRSEVPAGETLIGLLAHALAAEIFAPGLPPSPEVAGQRAEQRLPALIDEMASPLRLPGAAADYARVFSRLPTAMEVLAARLATLKATIVAPELDRDVRDGMAPGIELAGRIDLLIETKGNGPAVIDMKWSRGDGRRRKEIEAGHAVQLAVYGRLLGSDSTPAPGTYFMLSQARFLPAGDNLFGAAAGTGALPLAEVWANAKSSWLTRMKQLGEGRVEATGERLREFGVGDTEGDSAATSVALQREPPCAFCDKARLCGHAVLQ